LLTIGFPNHNAAMLTQEKKVRLGEPYRADASALNLLHFSFIG